MITKAFVWMETRLDEGGWVRRAYLTAALLMTGQFIFWGQKFAMESPRPGVDISLILGALGVPLSTLTGFAFREYLESRKRPAGESISQTTTTLEVNK